MLQEERHQFILAQISAQKKVHTEELSRSLKVSADSIRRDLILLERSGKISRVHGGAISMDFHTPFQPREVHAKKEKIQIARKALTLIKDGMTLLLAGGTVMLELARLLPRDLKGTLFTMSPLVALEATQRSSIDVILLSGRLSPDSYICTGASVISQLSEIRADLCLMGANGFSLKKGIMDDDWEVVQVKKAMLRTSAKSALLCISEKREVIQKLQVCPMHAVDYLITELSPSHKELAGYSSRCRVV